MSNAPASPVTEKVGVPVWLFGSFVAFALAAGGALFGALVDVRDSVRNHQLRVELLEKAQPSMLVVGQQLGALGQQMQTLSKNVDDMREDLRRTPRPNTPR